MHKHSTCYFTKICYVRHLDIPLTSVENGNDRYILLFCKKCDFCHLLPFAKVGQSLIDTCILITEMEWGRGGMG